MDDKTIEEGFRQGKHIGIIGDEERAKQIPENERCERCGGTGNELYSMYRRCSDCNGMGRHTRAL